MVGPPRRISSRRFPGRTCPPVESLTGATYGPTAPKSSATAAVISACALAALTATAAPSSLVVQPPSARRYTTAPSATRLAVTTTGPVTLIFFCSSGEVMGTLIAKRALRGGKPLTRAAPPVKNNFLYSSDFHSANRRKF